MIAAAHRSQPGRFVFEFVSDMRHIISPGVLTAPERCLITPTFSRRHLQGEGYNCAGR
jgi:hypothetical protein